MVVDYFHVFGTVGAFRPFKTNAPLLVDTDAVLPLAIAAKRFKVVAGKGGKIPPSHMRRRASYGSSATMCLRLASPEHVEIRRAAYLDVKGSRIVSCSTVCPS